MQTGDDQDGARDLDGAQALTENRTRQHDGHDGLGGREDGGGRRPGAPQAGEEQGHGEDRGDDGQGRDPPPPRERHVLRAQLARGRRPGRQARRGARAHEQAEGARVDAGGQPLARQQVAAVHEGGRQAERDAHRVECADAGPREHERQPRHGQCEWQPGALSGEQGHHHGVAEDEQREQRGVDVPEGREVAAGLGRVDDRTEGERSGRVLAPQVDRPGEERPHQHGRDDEAPGEQRADGRVLLVGEGREDGHAAEGRGGEEDQSHGADRAARSRQERFCFLVMIR